MQIKQPNYSISSQLLNIDREYFECIVSIKLYGLVLKKELILSNLLYNKNCKNREPPNIGGNIN